MSDHPYEYLAAAAANHSSAQGEAKSGGESARGSHRLASVRECPRYWWLRYGQNVRRVGGQSEKPYLLVGTLVHLRLAYYYAAKMETVPEPFCTVPLEEAVLDIATGHPDLIDQSKGIFDAYVKLDGYSTWIPTHVEQEFTATLKQLDPDGPDHTLNDEVVTCRTDLIVQNQGKLWIVDHKTVGGGWSKSLPRWIQENNDYAIPWQAMVYLHVVRQELPIAGLIINRLRRVEPYDFDRHVLEIPPMAYVQAPRAMREAIRLETEITFNAQQGVMPVPNLAACYKRYGQCDYIRVCAAQTKEEQIRLLGGD
jgi:hypothetical protein